MTTETGYVYTLSDPRTDNVRYVGATKHPEQRLQQHINHPHSEPLREWVSELDSDGFEPEMHVIRVSDTGDLSEVEQRALDTLSERFELLNTSTVSDYQPDRQRRTNTTEFKTAEQVSATVRMDGKGRITIPVAARERLGVEGMDAGESIPVEVTVEADYDV